VPVEVAGNAGHIAFPVKAPDGGLPSWPHSFVGDERRHSRSRLIHYSVPRSACRPGRERLASARTTSAPQLRTGGGIPRTRTHRSLGLPIRDGLWMVVILMKDAASRKSRYANVIFPTRRELLPSHHLAAARASDARNLCRFYAGLVFLIGRCALSARVSFHRVARKY